MAVHACLKNEFTEDERSHNLMAWLKWCNYPKIWTVWFCYTVMCHKDWYNGKQCRPWSGSALFAQTCPSEYLGSLQTEPQHDKTNNVASAQSDQSSVCTQWVAKDPNFLHADSGDPDQTGRMPKADLSLCCAHTHFVGFVMSWLNYVFFFQIPWQIQRHYGTEWRSP